MRSPAPSPWEELSLGDLVTRLVNGGTPPTSIAAYWQGSTPWITGADFTPSGLSEFRRFVSDEAVRETATNVIAKGELLLVTRTGVGKLAIAPCDVAISQDITGVYPDRQRVAVEFLYHRMRQGVEDLKKLNQGTSINGIVRNDLVSYRIALPPLPQQQRIAEILSTVDEAIEQTEALIAKTQQIKAGLMHDLFTRGVTADGQLRPPREQAPQRYKESPLGWIPKEWEVRQLSDVYGEPARNGLYKPAAFHGRGPFMVQMGNIFRGLTVDFEGAGRVAVTASELATYGLREDDLLFGRRSLVMEGAGKCALVGKLHEPSTFESSIIRVRLDRSQIVAEFAALFLSSEAAYRDRRRFIRQVAVSGVSGADVKQFTMILPSPDEQATICASIGAASRQLKCAKMESRKLMMLKRGLMQDLLSGSVSVAAEHEPEPKEVAASV